MEAGKISKGAAYYVALAQVLECELWTADLAMLQALENRLPFVRWIGEYQLPTE